MTRVGRQVRKGVEMGRKCLILSFAGGCRGVARAIPLSITATWVCAVLVLWSRWAFAAHPLITDDAGTQGTGKFQVELNGEYSRYHDSGTKEDPLGIQAILSYGLADRLDLVVGLPFEHLRVREGGAQSTHYGLSDLSVELKWRFLEDSGWAMAIKPGVSLPTGDQLESLGG